MKLRLPAFLAGFLLVMSANAGEGCYIPSYYDQADFLVGSPATTGWVEGAFLNPAAWSLMPGSEVSFHWADKSLGQSNLDRWTLLVGVPHLGFAAQHWKSPHFSFTDYSLALAGGRRDLSLGLGYTWSRGEIGNLPRDDLFATGLIWRPCRQISLGTSGTFAFNHDDMRWILDAGIRPFGSPVLTLFGDTEIWDHQDFDKLEWGMGLAAELLPGLTLAGKLRNGGGFSLGFSLNLGRASATLIPHYSKDKDLSYTSYGLRWGYLKRSIFSQTFQHSKIYLSLRMKGEIGYQRYKLLDPTKTLTSLLLLLEEVKADDRYAGVALNLSDMHASWALVWELREKLKEVKAASKRVVIFVDNPGMRTYYLASVADCLVMDPEGIIMLPGMAMGRTYYRRMLDKLGLGFDEWRFFKYKSAFESLARQNMSEADREQRQALIDDFYAEIRKDISQGRGFAPSHFDQIVNREIALLPERAVQEGLVDSLGRWTDVKRIVKNLEKDGKRFVGMKKHEQMRYKEEEWGRPPEVAIVYGLGACAMDEGLRARSLARVIEGLRDDKNVKAVVFRADSPGGEALASDMVAEELKKTAKKKPVIVSQGWVAGSGGYWISMYGQKIVATPLTITGSIGVIGGWIWDKGLGDKIGLDYDHVQVGEHADLSGGMKLPFIDQTVPERNLTAEERLSVEKLIRTGYKRFVTKVAEGRHMSEEEVEKIAQGRVWSAREGKKIGLVDEIGGLEMAIRMAEEAAGIPAGRKVLWREVPQKGLIDLEKFKPKLIQMQEDTYEMEYLRMLIKAKGRPLPMVPPDWIP
jgi:protease-4